MKKDKFKNISKQALAIPDFGIVEAGEIVELPENFNNANFQRVTTIKKVELKNSNNDDESK